MRIITADERLAEVNGPKVVIAGQQGIGKTSLLRTLSQEQLDKTLFFSIESGQSSIPDVAVKEVRPETWEECRDIACLLAGPDKAIADCDYGTDEINPYSIAHHESLKDGPLAAAVDGYGIWFIDSVSTASTWLVAWGKSQSTAWSDKKRARDTLGMYGEIGRQWKAWFNQIQRGLPQTVIYIVNMSPTKDDYGRDSWSMIMDGRQGQDELLRVVDVAAAMGFVDRGKIGLEGDGAVRALACRPECDDFPGFMPKCRTNVGGKTALDLYERPNLGALLDKLTPAAPVVAKKKGRAA